MRRAVGYCENVGSRNDSGCEDYAKGVFLLNHGNTFYCPRCRQMGLVVTEKGKAEGKSGRVFKEVRCEFDYSPATGTFMSIAIVRDESVWGSGRRYTLQSPLIRTEKRALKVAEAILSNLQHHSFDDDGSTEIPPHRETTLSFDNDMDVFMGQLKKLQTEWSRSTLLNPSSPVEMVKNIMD